jgi:hypothetical protein
MAESTFTLNQYFNAMLSYSELLEANTVYTKAIENTDFKLPNKDTLEFMLWAKRKKISFGPYQNLTFFEISNRIHSDLVLLEAAQILFEEHRIKGIQLKMSNHAGSDLIVIDKDNKEIKGEAFNTAPSFFQIKMRSELKKFKDDAIGIIAFNQCALSDKNKVFLEHKKLEYPKVLFVGCEI